MAACTVEQPAGQPLEPETEAVEKADDPSTISGVVNVQFTEEMADYIASMLGSGFVAGAEATKALADTRAEALSSAMEELGIASIERLFPDAGKWEPRHRAAGLHTWYRVTYDDSVTHTRAAASLEDIPYVCEVEIPRKIKTTATRIPFDDHYGRIMWSLYNDGSILAGFKSGADINVVPVWEQFTTGSSDVIVAVVDAGINIHHEELEGVVIPGTEDGGSHCFIYGLEGPELDPNDVHGTHVSGIVGAISNNGKGICGVAGGNDGTGGVRILGCQCLSEDKESGSKSGNSAAAIVWGADHGAVISQNSWGYSFDDYNDAKLSGITSSDKAAVDYFIANAGYDENGIQVGPMAGGVVFFAAGNDSWDHGWPAEYSEIIAVGAIGPDGRRTSYSNYGDWVDICAPGGESDRFAENTAAWVVGPGGDNKYYVMCGTSQACPHASGVAALLVSYFGGPGFTNDDLKKKLLYGANYFKDSKYEQIGPQLDAYGAFTATEPTAPVITTDYTGDFTLKSHESLSITYNILGAGRLPVDVSFDGGSDAAYGTLVDNNTFTLVINALKAEPGTYKASFTASYAGYSASQEITYKILENHSPVVTGSFSDSILEGKSDVLSLDMSRFFIDEDGENLSYRNECSKSDILSVSVSGRTLNLTPRNFGSTEVTLSAVDARGGKCSAEPFTVVVYDTSLGFSAYPVPVIDRLNISAGKSKDMKIHITNAAGSTVFDGTLKGDALSPAQVDMSSCASGQYSLSVAYGGETYSRKIVKK